MWRPVRTLNSINIVQSRNLTKTNTLTAVVSTDTEYGCVRGKYPTCEKHCRMYANRQRQHAPSCNLSIQGRTSDMDVRLLEAVIRRRFQAVWQPGSSSRVPAQATPVHRLRLRRTLEASLIRVLREGKARANGVAVSIRCAVSSRIKQAHWRIPPCFATPSSF